MRPDISDLLEGINQTIMRVGIPIVQQSGDMQALWEMAVSTRIMSYVQKRWKNQFGRLARENAGMAELLDEAVVALKAAGSARAEELAGIVSSSRCEIETLPPIDELDAANQELKRGLEIFIIAHSGMGGSGTAELEAARGKVREFLKQITLRDFEAAQELIFF